MENLRAQAANFFPWANRIGNRSTLAQLAALASKLICTLALGQIDVAPRYGGRAWCDTTEHDIANSIMRIKRARF